MPSTDIYAQCNFTRSGQPNIRFNVLIKLPKAKLEELRQLPANRDQTDNQLLGSLAGKVMPTSAISIMLANEAYLNYRLIPCHLARITGDTFDFNVDVRFKASMLPGPRQKESTIRRGSEKWKAPRHRPATDQDA
jgi:hypothetical protein